MVFTAVRNESETNIDERACRRNAKTILHTYPGEVREALDHPVYRNEARSGVPELFLLLRAPVEDISMPLVGGQPEKGNSRLLQRAGFC